MYYKVWLHSAILPCGLSPRNVNIESFDVYNSPYLISLVLYDEITGLSALSISLFFRSASLERRRELERAHQSRGLYELLYMSIPSQLPVQLHERKKYMYIY